LHTPARIVPDIWGIYVTDKKRKKRFPAGPCKVKSLKALRSQLKRHGVNYADWGTGYTKTVQDLMKEIRLGESMFVVRRGQLIRQVNHAQVKITCVIDGVLHRLVETRQEFANGAIRPREGDRSLSEKIQTGESRKNAAIRGVREELNLQTFKGEGLKPDPVEERRRRFKPSAVSYPGLPVLHIEFLFNWVMQQESEFFRREGYVERQKRKTTYFEWQVA